MSEELPLLVPASVGAKIIGVSERTFHAFRKREDFPKPIVLGPRAVRWRRQEIEAWVAGLQVETMPRPQPERLANSKRGRKSAEH